MRIKSQPCLVDTRQPASQPHMTQDGRQGSRQRRLKSERQREIERGNVLLLNKMMKINERGGRWVS